MNLVRGFPRLIPEEQRGLPGEFLLLETTNGGVQTDIMFSGTCDGAEVPPRGRGGIRRPRSPTSENEDDFDESHTRRRMSAEHIHEHGL